MSFVPAVDVIPADWHPYFQQILLCTKTMLEIQLLSHTRVGFPASLSFALMIRMLRLAIQMIILAQFYQYLVPHLPSYGAALA